MEKALNLLLVEDDQATCKDIVSYVDTLDEVNLIGVTNNSARAIEYICDYLPDAIILDLELHMGGGNGLLVLQQMEQLSLPVRPYVLVTTNNSSTVTHATSRQLGADFIMTKYQDGYTAKSPVDFLLMMKPVIQSTQRQMAAAGATTESPALRSKRITQRIQTELNCVGISPKAVGYRYLMRAIQLVIDKPTQNLSTIIGKEFGKSEPSVERAMQNAIARAWRASDIDDLLRFYTAHINSEKGVPTITEFVYYYATKLKSEY